MAGRKSARRRKFLWVTDPWETLDHAQDTTLRLAREAVEQGHESFWCDIRTIRLEENAVVLDAAPLSANSESGAAKQPFPARLAAPSSFSSVHYRVDPPVDLAYLHPLQLLVLGEAKLVNPAEVLFAHNEKFEAGFLKHLFPASLVSSRWEDLSRFGQARLKTVLKPLHQAQSKGVQLLSWDSPALAEKNRVTLSAATDGFTRPILLQQYLAGISQGEQRLWFLDGKLLACVRKMPLEGDFRVDMDRGSALRETKLSSAEKKAAQEIGKLLRQRKIRLAAVDLIEGLVTDLNFTSPGLITPMEKVLAQNLARPIIKALAK